MFDIDGGMAQNIGMTMNTPQQERRAGIACEGGEKFGCDRCSNAVCKMYDKKPSGVVAFTQCVGCGGSEEIILHTKEQLEEMVRTARE